MREAYLRMFQQAPLEAIQTLGRAAAKCVDELRTVPHASENMRVLFILAELPLFTNFSVYAQMIEKYTEAILSLSEEAMSTLKVCSCISELHTHTRTYIDRYLRTHAHQTHTAHTMPCKCRIAKTCLSKQLCIFSHIYVLISG